MTITGSDHISYGVYSDLLVYLLLRVPGTTNIIHNYQLLC